MSVSNGTEVVWSQVELIAGTIKATGKWTFIIDAVDTEGGRATFHVCDHYDEAIRLGEETRNAFEIEPPVRDLVVGDN